MALQLCAALECRLYKVEIHRLEECRLGVVPEAVPPVQTLQQNAVLRANFAKTLIFFAKNCCCIYTSLVSNESLNIALNFGMTLTGLFDRTHMN